MRIGSLFTGAGMLDVAVQRAFDGDVIWQCESNPAAAKILQKRFPEIPNLGDITALDWSAVEPIDVLCGGFPCFPAGTLIDAGDDGLRPIETLRVGDMVLTHKHRRRAVTSVMRREAEDVLLVKAMGTPDFRTTSEHPFYVLRGRDAVEPEWVLAGELRKGDYFAMPLDDATDQTVLGPDLAYVVGRWLGDGWIVDHKRTSKIVGKRGSRVDSRVHKAIICCAHHEADALAASIAKAGLHSTRVVERTVTKFHISSQKFVKTLRPFGRGAVAKHLPGAVFTAPQDERTALLQGWLDADGCRTHGQWKATTVSEQLAHGMARLARSVHRRAISVHRVRPSLTKEIEGRIVNQRPWYQVVIPDRNREAFIRDGFVWVPLCSVDEAPPCEVFNVSVDEDESYTAWGYTVHNCQDMSAAGRRAGMGQGTRSGLWVYMADAIAALKPTWVVIENVRGILSTRAHRTVGGDELQHGPGEVEPAEGVVGDHADGSVLRCAGAVLGDLADLGFDAEWTTVSASTIGAPHRRERFFCVAYSPQQLGALIEKSHGRQSAMVGAVARAGGGDRAGRASSGVPVMGRGAGSQPAAGHGKSAAVAEGDGRDQGRPEHARVERGSDAAVGSAEDGPLELLPTPTVKDMGDRVDSAWATEETLEWWDRFIAQHKAKGYNGNGHGRSLAIEVQRTLLLPTPCAQQSGCTPEDSIKNKPPGRKQITDLAILAANPELMQTGGLLPTPTSRDHKGRNQRDDDTCLSGALLPTPTAADGHPSSPGRHNAEGHQDTLPGAVKDLLPTPVATDAESSARHTTGTGTMHSGTSLTDALRLLPTPSASDGDGGKTSRSGDRADEPLLGAIHKLLPTPNAHDGDRNKGARSDDALARGRGGVGGARPDRQKGLPDLPRLLPTPAAADHDRRQDYARANREGSGGDDLVTAAVKATNESQWGRYALAVGRWESITRPAPAPTEPNTRGNPRLSPAFSEWMMGWSKGWVTEPGLIGRNDQLRIIGNGVVPQQAFFAITHLLSTIVNEIGA